MSYGAEYYYESRRREEIGQRNAINEAQRTANQALNEISNCERSEAGKYLDKASLNSIRNSLNTLAKNNSYRASLYTESQGLLSSAKLLVKDAQAAKKRADDIKRQEAREYEAKRVAELKRQKDLYETWTREFESWENKFARSLVAEELEALRQRACDPSKKLDLPALQVQIEALKNKSTQLYRAHQEREQLLTKHQTKVEIATEVLESLKKVKSKSSIELEQKLSQAISNNDLPDDFFSDIQQQAHEISNREAIRKEVITATYQALNKVGFVVGKPRKISENGQDIVVVSAQRPNGNRALFKVELDGKLTYKFDNYEGKLCKNDIDQVVPMLEEIYGIELSKERILWENPDDIKKTAKPVAPMHTASSSGNQ